MRMVDIIIKKRDGEELTKQEIDFFINGYVNNQIPDYQVSSLLMAILLKGMTNKETFYLTEAMLYSGDIMDLTKISGVKVDKHSTGGVGDKVSLIVGPIIASCGAKLAKMSGRGLGHSGGTLDKLESIPNMNVNLSEEEFIRQVNDIGIAIIGQTKQLVPADKKLYALRDVTGTVDSIPLIASSIMSKKLASGADTILLDVKFGSGAFMKTVNQAKKLANIMVEIGKYFKKDTRAEITSMANPLGRAIGNSLEVKEAVNTLLGNGPSDLVEICLESAATMLLQAKLVNSLKEGMQLAKTNLDNKKAYEVFRKFVIYQSGDVSYIDNLDKFEKSKYTYQIKSKQDGYIKNIDALTIGVSACKLGAGREKKEDIIDYSAGIYLNKKVGEKVSNGEIIATIYTSKENIDDVLLDIYNAYSFSTKPVKIPPIIYDVIE